MRHVGEQRLERKKQALGTTSFNRFTEISYRTLGTDFGDEFRQVSGFENASDLAI
jgi:hypothetical protein